MDQRDIEEAEAFDEEMEQVNARRDSSRSSSPRRSHHSSDDVLPALPRPDPLLAAANVQATGMPDRHAPSDEEDELDPVQYSHEEQDDDEDGEEEIQGEEDFGGEPAEEAARGVRAGHRQVHTRPEGARRTETDLEGPACQVRERWLHARRGWGGERNSRGPCDYPAASISKPPG